MNSGRYGYINFCISGLRIMFFMYSKDASSSSSSGISAASWNGLLLLEDVLASVSTVSSKNDFFGASCVEEEEEEEDSPTQVNSGSSAFSSSISDTVSTVFVAEPLLEEDGVEAALELELGGGVVTGVAVVSVYLCVVAAGFGGGGGCCIPGNGGNASPLPGIPGIPPGIPPGVPPA